MSLIRLETPDHALADGEDGNVSIDGISTTKEQFDEITLSEQPSRAQMRTTSFAPKRLRAARAPQPGVPSGSSQVDGPSLSQVFSLAMLANKFMPSTAKTSPSEDQAPENASSVRKVRVGSFQDLCSSIDLTALACRFLSDGLLPSCGGAGTCCL